MRDQDDQHEGMRRRDPRPAGEARARLGPADPRYPEIHVRLRTRHPLAAISAVRHALRRAGAAPSEVRRFTEEALADVAGEASEIIVPDVFRAWAVIDFV